MSETFDEGFSKVMSLISSEEVKQVGAVFLIEDKYNQLQVMFSPITANTNSEISRYNVGVGAVTKYITEDLPEFLDKLFNTEKGRRVLKQAAAHEQGIKLVVDNSK